MSIIILFARACFILGCVFSVTILRAVHYFHKKAPSKIFEGSEYQAKSSISSENIICSFIQGFSILHLISNFGTKNFKINIFILFLSYVIYP